MLPCCRDFGATQSPHFATSDTSSTVLFNRDTMLTGLITMHSLLVGKSWLDAPNSSTHCGSLHSFVQLWMIVASANAVTAAHPITGSQLPQHLTDRKETLEQASSSLDSGIVTVKQPSQLCSNDTDAP